VKTWVCLHSSEPASVDPDAKEHATEYTNTILQHALRDANLDLQAHAITYNKLLHAVQASIGRKEEQSKGSKQVNPEDLMKALFLSDAEHFFASVEGSEESSLAESSSCEFGSLSLSLAGAYCYGSASSRVPAWAAQGTAVPSAKRDPPVASSSTNEKKGGLEFVSSLPPQAGTPMSGSSRTGSPAPATRAALSAASAHDYFVEDGTSSAAAPTRAPSSFTAQKGSAGGSSSPFASSSRQARPTNSKYKDLESFLDEEPEEAPIVPLPTSQLQNLNLLQQPAPQDEEYLAYDEDDFEVEEVAVEPSYGIQAEKSRYGSREDEAPDSDDFEEEEEAGVKGFTEGREHTDRATRHDSTNAMLPVEENAWA
jgi:hypothetical protein